MSALRSISFFWPLINSSALELVPCASQSCRETVLPACRNASYSRIETVLFPTPPFFASRVIFIYPRLHTLMRLRKLVCLCSLVTLLIDAGAAGSGDLGQRRA